MGICVVTSGCRELGHNAKPRVVFSVSGWDVSLLGRRQYIQRTCSSLPQLKEDFWQEMYSLGHLAST